MIDEIKVSCQAPSSIVMIRPHHFTVNPQTAADNAFQMLAPLNGSVARRAFDEITAASELLQSHGVRVHLFEDEGDQTPDSVFPNNWFSTHGDGRVAIYPMKAKNRRLERRQDIIEMLKSQYHVQSVSDYSGLEYDELYLEGTGAMVIDHANHVAYAAQSERTNPALFERFCSHFGFEPVFFTASDRHNVAVYHTNVMMCIATEFAMICLRMIADINRRKDIITRLEKGGRGIVDLSEIQISQYAANAIELQANTGRILALSQSAFDALNKSQKNTIERSATMVPLAIPTIELAGGSVRCTIAGIHLKPR